MLIVLGDFFSQRSAVTNNHHLTDSWFFHIKILNNPVIKGHNLSCLIEKNKLSCQICHFRPEVTPFSSVTTHLHFNQSPASTYTFFSAPALPCPWLSHLMSYKGKGANIPVFKCSNGPGLRFRYASKYPNTTEVLGLWFPFGPYCVKQRCVFFFSVCVCMCVCV